jgi:tetratricopeptide (TPR) repeat protein
MAKIGVEMGTPKSYVKTQDLLGFTVKIFNAETEEDIGTGIVISSDGKILTCAHVVEDADVDPKKVNGKNIGIFFPKLLTGDKKEMMAKVKACFANQDDDIVLLQLTNKRSPIPPEKLAVLGTAEHSLNNPFASFGYSPVGDYPACRANGTILGPVPPPDDLTVLTYPLQLGSRQISSGMSGSAVLDINRNLVVGLITERYFAENAVQDNIGYAVDARVLTFDPLILQLRDSPLPKVTAPQPKTDFEKAKISVADKPGMGWNNAPTLIEEWVGREDLLGQISEDWKNPDVSITGLIGFGGEGKSSLVRQWLDNLLKDKTQPKPDGIFWWGFYTRQNTDEFFEAALKYMSGGKADPSQYPSASSKAHFISAMLYSKRVIFILDGLEVMQYQTGDQYGLLKSNDLRNFLEYFGSSDHNSFCLITSRAPMLDLMDYITYNHRDVMRMSEIDGRNLLRKVGVKGKDEELDKVVKDWDGYALILSLIGACLKEKHDGDVTHASEIDPPTSEEKRHERVHRVLCRYDKYLKEEDKAFLKLFSAFRNPVKEDSFEKVFRADMGPEAINAPIAKLNDDEFKAMIKRLVTCRILRHDPNDKSYTAHPLIRKHYEAEFVKGGEKAGKKAHEQIKKYYTEIASDVPKNPTLDDLNPWIEVVHHACLAGAYDEAFMIYWDNIHRLDQAVITRQLGAYEMDLFIMQDFFQNGNMEKEPMVSDQGGKGYILNETGLCLMSMGQLRNAIVFFERASKIYLEIGAWLYNSVTYVNLSELHAHLGQLNASSLASEKAIRLAEKSEDKKGYCTSLTFLARAANLIGEFKKAGEFFIKAEKIQKEIQIDIKFLYSQRGIYQADYLIRTDNIDRARQITEANLLIVKDGLIIADRSMCQRVLGDLDAQEGKHDDARKHYDEALKIARGITRRDVLIEALLARGRWYAKYQQDSDAAFSDLNEALEYATDSGYRIYEADIRVALAWAHIAKDEYDKAREQAEYAKRMSEEMGYYWGTVDAEDVLTVLE